MNLRERNENMRDFFNRKIDTYDEVHAQFMQTKKLITENLKSTTKKVLDLGVGTGLELIYLFERFPNAEVTAVDITENMLEALSKRKFANKIQAICGDFFQVDFGQDFDAVISTSALHHFLIEDKKRLYKKVYTSLKTNGEFINVDKFANSLEEEKQLLQEYYDYKDERSHCDTPLAIDNEVKILKEVGFKDIVVLNASADNYYLIKATK